MIKQTKVQKTHVTLCSKSSEKTSMELLEKVLDGKNLFETYRRVYKNKEASGADEVIVDEHT